MKDLKIEVSSIANLVTNADFSRWYEDVPLGWTVSADTSGTVVPFPFEGGFACGVIDISDTTETYIIQEVGTLTTGDNYTLSFIARGKATIYLEDNDGGWATVTNGSQRFRSEDWVSHEINITIESSTPHRIKIQPEYTTGDPDFDYCYVNVINLYKSDWYSDKKRLKIDEVMNIEDLSREIEDDIFTFKSDAVSLEVYNYGSVGNYFNPEDFITNSERIFRFDMTFDYDDSVSKSITLFSNNDTIKRIRQPGSDVFRLELYELPTLFKDNGWFLGELAQDLDDDGDPEGDAYFMYESHPPNNTGYYSNVTLSNVITSLSDDIKTLMKQRVIPVRESDFSISNNISAGAEYTTIPYLDTIGVGDDEFYVLDYVVAPTNRFFVLLVSTYDYGANIHPHTFRIYELLNGSYLHDTGKRIPLGNGIGDGSTLGLTANACFVHRYDSDYYDSNFNDGEEIEFIACTFHTDSNNNYYFQGYYFTNDPQSPANLQLLGNPSIEQLPTEDDALQGKCMYIGSDGNYVYPDYSATNDNTLYINNNPIATIDAYGYQYDFSDLVSDGTTGVLFDLYYSRNMVANIPRFQQVYSFRLKNMTPSDMLKEIAITQDAVWYLSYSGSQISVNIYTRDDDTVATTDWTDTDWIYSNESVRIIRFNDLRSQLFFEDKNRMLDFIGYYNYKYGNGRGEIEAQEWGYHDYGLRDIIRYNDKTYFVKQVSLENYNYATNFRIFEIWQ